MSHVTHQVSHVAHRASSLSLMRHVTMKWVILHMVVYSGGVGGFCKNLIPFSTSKLLDFVISLKDASRQMQFMCAIKEMASLIPCLKKRNVVGNPHRIDHHRPKICSNPNFLVHYKSSWTGANTHMSFNGWNIPLKKVPAFLKSNTVRQNLNLGSVTVFVFLSTFHLTTLLWKGFHLRRHCYTLTHRHKWVRPLIWVINVAYVKWHRN